jgi:hypothetical protein
MSRSWSVPDGDWGIVKDERATRMARKDTTEVKYPKEFCIRTSAECMVDDAVTWRCVWCGGYEEVVDFQLRLRCSFERTPI